MKKLQRHRVDNDRGEWCLSEDVAALEAENETLKEHLADKRRMLLWLRNHYELYDYKRKDAKTFRAKVIARVDKQDCDDLFYVIASLLDEHLEDSAAQGSPAWDAADKIMHRW